MPAQYVTRQANEAKAAFIDNLRALLKALGKTNKAICLEAELTVIVDQTDAMDLIDKLRKLKQVVGEK